MGGDSLDGVCFNNFLCYRGQCFTCLQILLSRLERGSNKGSLLAISLVKGTSRPDGRVASESAEVALFESTIVSCILSADLL